MRAAFIHVFLLMVEKNCCACKTAICLLSAQPAAARLPSARSAPRIWLPWAVGTDSPRRRAQSAA